MKNSQLVFSNFSRGADLWKKFVSTYSTAALLFAFVVAISFSINNYITKKLTLNISPDIISEIDSQELDGSENLSEVIVKKGDTLSKIFAKQNISSQELSEITKALKAKKIEFNLMPGQVITFEYSVSDIDYSQDSLNDYLLKEVNIALSSTRNIVITKSNGIYEIKDIQAQLKRMFVKHNVKIKNSFVEALMRIGINASNIQELVNAYSYQVDFQRQIKSGDTISVVTEKFYSEDGDFVHGGKVLYSSLNLSGNVHNIYWFKDEKSGSSQYYSENGMSVKRNLLRTPINVARVSSGYGKRHHPVLGYTKMHKGIDFAAPTGTPILAAGDGVIKEMGYRGAYGNIIRIKHSANLTTAYAHASKFPSNLKVGSKVKQGQVVAFVGKTGRATGPHCHFEVIINGKNVNPMSVQTTPGVELKSKSLAMFNKHKKLLQEYLKELEENKPSLLANI